MSDRVPPNRTPNARIETDRWHVSIPRPNEGSPPPPPSRGGATLLRAVAFSLAVFSHALAPLGGRWGAVPAGAGASPAFTAAALFGTPLQWFGAAFVLSAIASGAWARLLRGASAFQPIRDDAPASHRATKARTPTAGGAAFVPAGCLVALVFTRCRDAPVVACVLATLAFAAIGFADDRGKLASGRNDAGLSPVAKLAAQSAVASALFAFLSVAGDASGAFRVDTAVPLLGGVVLELGRGFWALAAFATVAESNAVNVADGLDGLAASASAIALCALGAVTLHLGRAELAAFAFSTAGAAAGFLVVNRHPAACFMGDCGSLALGGALGAVAGAAGGAATFPLFVVTGAFVVETLSVLAQVGWFKLTRKMSGGKEGKRLLRMAPLHHHLELGGWRETAVVAAFAIAGGVFAAAGMYVNAANARGAW